MHYSSVDDRIFLLFMSVSNLISIRILDRGELEIAEVEVLVIERSCQADVQFNLGSAVTLS